MNDTFLGYYCYDLYRPLINLVSEDIYSFTYGSSDSPLLPFPYTCSS